jgi:hypothetical protein
MDKPVLIQTAERLMKDLDGELLSTMKDLVEVAKSTCVNVPPNLHNYDLRARRNVFPIDEAICWNGMTSDQQKKLALMGVIEKDKYGGGPCPNKATEKVEIGNKFGPRFYCSECAVKVRAEQ